MSNISNALIWELTKKNSCFLKKNKRGGSRVFSCDPYNVYCKNTPSNSGLVKDNCINVRILKRKPVLLVKKLNEKNGVVTKECKTKNIKNVEKLIEEYGKNEKEKNKRKLLKKYKRLFKVYCNTRKRNK
ncbi:60S ribosomal protein L28, putative [Plasmodium gallinaceum]|uniref:60S ribosomal protein L28, putative n=1 Tax=Plasmodium gallinaceum TaxID=5849 RepID=A0A1J1GZM5_PLAGA|nr:60S ribosomal protein L28, putative [Plasmodium gallinaceum]CRG96475.1 60S ribosomal protein L28, putative [Plasmodium gallinaceum]